MDITYGIEVLAENDPYVEMAEAALDSVNRASTPGAYMVDVFPLLKFVPAWVPGAGFQRKAKEWKRLLDDVIDMPYAVLKKQMASEILGIGMRRLTSYNIRPMVSKGPRLSPNRFH